MKHVIYAIPVFEQIVEALSNTGCLSEKLINLKSCALIILTQINQFI